ncbi:MAG: hypothetical protein ACON4U_14500 [Myxococcota bacterium]
MHPAARIAPAAIAAAVIALGSRLLLIFLYPGVFAFDGFQRWAGREFLLIRDWLPATQSLIVLTSPFDSPTLTRFMLALVASLSVMALVQISTHFFGKRVGWYTVPIAAFGPFSVWSSTLYQEGTFLFFCLGAVALTSLLPQKRLWIADLMAGGMALTRYEGWPVLLLYLLWRRDKKALIGLWGAALWLGVKGLSLEGYAPSPIDYADWNELSERMDLSIYLTQLNKGLFQSFESGALGVWLLAIPSMIFAIRKRHKMGLLLLLIWLSQAAAVAGWIAGLETTIQRMQVIMTVIAMPFCALTLSRFKSIPFKGAVLAGLVVMGLWTRHALDTAARNHRSFQAERHLALEIEACQDCRWHISPRTGLGTRDRHDGCEILQGVSTLTHGVDFWCLAWGSPEHPASHTAQWKKRGYTTERIGE